VGLTQDQARAAITAAGLVPGNVQRENVPVDADKVTKTEPVGKTPVAKGSTVAIFVASGQVDLPDLTGKTRQEATDILASLKLNSSTNPVEIADKAPDTVLSQDRSGLVAQGTTVTLDIAVAPTNVVVPSDLVDKTYADASAQLTALGLVPAKVQRTSTKAVDVVLYSDPNKGATVAIGSTVTLNVSGGPTFVEPTTAAP
jgi:eukaryotic-like serine/threonine-protein kinase